MISFGARSKGVASSECTFVVFIMGLSDISYASSLFRALSLSLSLCSLFLSVVLWSFGEKSFDTSAFEK
jgi:hypothetical protein